jgi:hypothetical protein
MVVIMASPGAANVKMRKNFGLMNIRFWGRIIPLTGLLITLSLMPYQVDDAYITYRYAQNLAAGEGFVYNPGAEAVEGYSSPLWMLLLSAGALLIPQAGIPYLGMVLGISAYLALLTVWARISRDEPPAVRLLTALLLTLWPGLLFYASTGMETLLFVLCVLVFQAAAMGLLSGRLGAVAGFLALWIRPEGAFLLVALAFSLLAGPFRLRLILTRRLIIPGLSVIAGGLVLTVFRGLVFGDLLPNTYHAKIPDLGAGLAYLRSFVLSWPGGMLMLLAVLGGVLGTEKHRGFLLAGLAWLTAPVIEGGDWMPHHRFILPAVVWLLAAVLGLGQTRLRSLRWGGYALGLGLAATIAWQALVMIETARYSFDKLTVREKAIAEWVREFGVLSVASVDIGVLGYESGAEIIDVVGLTDRFVSRSEGGHLSKRFNLDYLFEHRRPQALVLRSTRTPVIEKERLVRCRPGSEIEKRIFLDERLHRDYRPVLSLDVRDNPRQSKLLFIRRDLSMAKRIGAYRRVQF